MTWNPLDEPIDFVMLGGQRTPGIASIEDAANIYHWDERRGYGLSGATSVYRGQGLSHLKLLIRLYTAQDWADWDAFRPVLAPPPPPTPSSSQQSAQAEATQLVTLSANDPSLLRDKTFTDRLASAQRRAQTVPAVSPRGQIPHALEIVHPLTEMLGIRAVTIESLKQPTQTGDGEWTIDVGLLEYRRPQPAAYRPDGARERSTDPVDQVQDGLVRIVQNNGEGPVLQTLAPLRGFGG